jgi:hypothetical protein
MVVNYGTNLDEIKNIFIKKKELRQQEGKQVMALLDYTIKQISANVKEAAGQKVLVRIKGQSDGGGIMSSYPFEKIFIGTIDPTAQGVIEEPEKAAFEPAYNLEIPVTALVEKVGVLPQRFTASADGKLYLHVNCLGCSHNWNSMSLMLSMLPKEIVDQLTSHDFLFDVKHPKFEIRIGDKEVDDYLQTEYTPEQCTEIKSALEESFHLRTSSLEAIPVS